MSIIFSTAAHLEDFMNQDPKLNDLVALPGPQPCAA